MKTLHLDSEEALCLYFQKFLKTNTKAAQLDGAKKLKASPKVVVIFQYTGTGKSFKLRGDVTREAIEHFVRLVDERGSAVLALKEYQELGRRDKTVIFSDCDKPHPGWRCEPFVEKSSKQLFRQDSKAA